MATEARASDQAPTTKSLHEESTAAQCSGNIVCADNASVIEGVLQK